MIHPTSTLLDAAALLADTGERYVTVVDTGRRVVGMLGEPAVETFLEGQRPVLNGPLGDRLRKAYVSDIMVAVPFVAREDTPLFELAMELAHHNLELIPVVDENEQLVGVVWPTDLERRLSELVNATGPR
jgi:CBS domain-containing protein